MNSEAWDWSRRVVDHLDIHASDFPRSVQFYETVLAPLGIPKLYEHEDSACFTHVNVVAQAPPTTNLHLCFHAGSRSDVDAFHCAGTAAGFRSNGEPGLRDYAPGYYAAYLLDPDGNNVEALYRDLGNPGFTGYSPTGNLGRWHDEYERGRPGWPAEVVDIPGLPSTATVLEVGAGTGKLTRLLLTAFDHVVAVEPDEEMRRRLAARCPEARVLAGRADDIPLADSSVDAVFVAEAFHLFDGERARAEFARVLRPRGALVVMWNLPVRPADPAIAAVEELLTERAPPQDELGYDPADLNSRRYASGEWRIPFAGSPFEELQEARLANPQTVDRDGLVAFFASMGWFAELLDAEQSPLRDEVRSLLPAPEYRREWETHVHWTRLAT